MSSDPQAIVISGVYGVGKSTMAAQIADILDARGVRYAALDLDWLSWAWVEEGGDDDPVDRLMLEHLDLVVRNLRRRGNDRFVLAGAVMSTAAWDAIRQTLAMQVRLVRLSAPIERVRERLANEPTTGRDEDARQTEAWIAAPPDDLPTPDLEVANLGPIEATALAILDWTSWLEAPGPAGAISG